ncbi:baculoviral IAP repeat-containing protein 7-B-like [Melanaphis sacchari]|uniref:baculoviral IAP repeat-containing protein 7-B-like n=1 Tax=Melanaphis sacchari TaxID=742174 RepID=UPI000DC159D5|nr:baculoviral IAP repeat-containing protein 7-B-like [Melanaphis sacchari]
MFSSRLVRFLDKCAILGVFICGNYSENYIFINIGFNSQTSKIKALKKHASSENLIASVEKWILYWIKNKMMTFQSRWKSFDEKWVLSYLTPFELAQAGLFYSGDGDNVICFDCRVNMFSWKPGDDPLCEHIRFSPDCGFINYILSTVKGRMKTFYNWPVDFLKPREMAEAGFHYTGFRDCVKCSSCKKDFDNWERNDIPFTEHMFHSPRCPFVIEYKDIYHNSSTAVYRSRIEVKNIEDRLDSEGNGHTDLLTCFYCGNTLSHWNETHEPWRVHVKWSKTCRYLLLKKGKSFGDMVDAVDSDIINSKQLELFKLIDAQKNTLALDYKMRIQSTKKHFGKITITNTSNKIQENLFQKLNHNSVPDCMMCKICCKEEIEVAIVPCGHAIACIECTLALEQCAICRISFTKLMRIYLWKDKKQKLNKFLQLIPFSFKIFSNTLNSMLCKVCNKEEIATVFLPCRHVYTCVKCAEEADTCLVCGENVFSFIQLYF